MLIAPIKLHQLKACLLRTIIRSLNWRSVLRQNAVEINILFKRLTKSLLACKAMEINKCRVKMPSPTLL